jgi:hypothetical protein
MGVWFRNIRWRGVGPEDKEGWMKIKRITRDSILGVHPLISPGWQHHKYYQQTVFPEDLGPCIPDGGIQAELVDGVR